MSEKTSSSTQETLIGLVKAVMAEPELAGQVAHAATLVMFAEKARQNPNFKSMLGGHTTLDPSLKQFLEAAGVKPNTDEMGYFPYPDRGHRGANAFCLSHNEQGELCILLAKNPNGEFTTPQGFMSGRRPSIDDPRNETADVSLEDTAVRELREEAGIDAKEHGVKPVLVSETSRILNPNGNGMSFGASGYMLYFKGCPQAEKGDGEIKNVQWIPLNAFAPDPNTEEQRFTITLPDGTDESVEWHEVYPEAITNAVNKYLDDICLSGLNMNIAGVTSRFSGFPEQPDVLLGEKAQEYIDKVLEAVEVLKTQPAPDSLEL